MSHSAGEFLFSKVPSKSVRTASYAFPTSVAFRPPKNPDKDFDGSDYVDLCPQNSSPIHSFLHKLLTQHFRFRPADGRVVAYVQSLNKGL